MTNPYAAWSAGATIADVQASIDAFRRITLEGNTGSTESPIAQLLNGLSNDLEAQTSVVTELYTRADVALAPDDADPSGRVEAERPPASVLEHRLAELGERLNDNTMRIRRLVDRLRI